METNELTPAPVFNTARKKTSSHRIIWTPEMISDFKKRYPVEFNTDLANDFKCDVRTILRRAREFGVEKTGNFIQINKAEIVRRIQKAITTNKVNGQAQ